MEPVAIQTGSFPTFPISIWKATSYSVQQWDTMTPIVDNVVLCFNILLYRTNAAKTTHTIEPISNVEMMSLSKPLLGFFNKKTPKCDQNVSKMPSGTDP